jgi:hypothetical protein
VPRTERLSVGAFRPPDGEIYVLNIEFCRIVEMDPGPWLARVRHDLVKRLVWPARDRRDAGGPVAPGELVAPVIDEEGHPTTAAALWAAMAADAPAGTGVDAFAAAVDRAAAAARAGDLDGVLALEAAFVALARSLEGGPG